MAKRQHHACRQRQNHRFSELSQPRSSAGAESSCLNAKNRVKGNRRQRGQKR